MDDITPPPKRIKPTEPEQPVTTAPELAAGPEVVNEPMAADTSEADTQAKPDDFETEAAVDDIMKQDGDADLIAQDEVAEKAVVMKTGLWEKLKNVLANWWADPRKRYGTFGVLLVILAVLFAVPFTRYNLLGLVCKSDVTVQAVDSKTGSAVSGARVELAGKIVQTEATGKATLRLHTGSKTLMVSKKYYGGYTHKQMVTLSGTHNHFKATLLPMGRQVQLKVVDKVSGKPVSGAVVTIDGAHTKTKSTGLATVIVPSGAASQQASISASGYNATASTITADGTVAKNTVMLAPAGKLYFLSNLSGKIDVIKTNLDGSSRQTVLAGTGSEDPRSTSLLASRDWKYLALLSKRSGNYASVYLIDTTNGDKLTTIDQGNADFSLVGWSGDNFVYQVTRGDLNDWQANKQALKSLDAASGQTLLLDQTQASGTSQNDYLKQSFGSPYIIGSQVVYAKNWDASYNNLAQINGKQAELTSIGSDGSGHKMLKSFSPDASNQSTYVSITTKLYEPDGLYVEFATGTQDTFYKYDNGSVSTDSNLNATTYYQTDYPTYLLSPSGNSTFWSEQRDGKNTLFVGDQDGSGQKQIASLSSYAPYGWYSDKYLLVSKDSSELYILPSTGGTPLKITDYYKPPINYSGYGGGYGGL